MTGYKIVNLKLLIDELGEEPTKALLSKFSCPLNSDVEGFLRTKAIEFSKNGFSQTHLVFANLHNGRWIAMRPALKEAICSKY